MKLSGRTAVITGAGSGIGRGIAQAFAARGCNLALADINETGLAETAAMLSGGGDRPGAGGQAATPLAGRTATSSDRSGDAKVGPEQLPSKSVRITTHRLDVADKAAVAALPDAVLAEHGRVHVLVNNAGVAVGGTFQEQADEDFEWLFDINFWGVVRMTRAFLPLLRAADEGRVVNISSIFGIIAPPGQTSYSASKFAVRAFSESLRNELAAEKANVGVTVVHPGGIRTSIAANARAPRGTNAADLEAKKKQFEKFLRMPPERAGEIIAKGVEGRKARVLVGNDARFMAIVERIAPTSYWKFLGRGLQ